MTISNKTLQSLGIATAFGVSALSFCATDASAYQPAGSASPYISAQPYGSSYSSAAPQENAYVPVASSANTAKKTGNSRHEDAYACNLLYARHMWSDSSGGLTGNLGGIEFSYRHYFHSEDLGRFFVGGECGYAYSSAGNREYYIWTGHHFPITANVGYELSTKFLNENGILFYGSLNFGSSIVLSSIDDKDYEYSRTVINNTLLYAIAGVSVGAELRFSKDWVARLGYRLETTLNDSKVNFPWGESYKLGYTSHAFVASIGYSF